MSGETPAPKDEVPDPQEGFKPITTQDELDRVISGRIQRVSAKFADYDDLKSQISGFDARLETARSEGRAKAESGLSDRLFEAEAKAAAAAVGFHDPLDAISAFGPRDGVVSGLDIDSAKLTQRLTEIATQKPYLVKAQQEKSKIALKPRITSEAKDKPETPKSSKGARAAAALRDFSSTR